MNNDKFGTVLLFHLLLSCFAVALLSRDDQIGLLGQLRGAVLLAHIHFPRDMVSGSFDLIEYVISVCPS